MAVPPDWQGNDYSVVKRVSPEEFVFAFITGMAKDLKKNKNIDEWRQCMLCTTMEYKIAQSEDDMYWLGLQLREDVVVAHAALRRTTLQKIFDVLAYKKKIEAVSGPLSALKLSTKYQTNIKVAADSEQISCDFIDSACTIGTRVLSNIELRRMLLVADEMPNNIFQGISKFQAIVSKAVTKPRKHTNY